MALVVLRLQGLNTDAGSEDIRHFFCGLYIPKGCVHIIGGEKGEAFIIFKTERDGQLAMRHSGKPLKGSPVSLHISSVAELKRRMESRLKKPKPTVSEPKIVPSSPAETDTALLLSLMAAIHGLHSNHTVNQQGQAQQTPENIYQNFPKTRTVSFADSQRNTDAPQNLPHELASMEETSRGENLNSSKPGYLRLYGFPDSVAKQEIFQFLRGLPVLEVITKVRLELGWCCMVKLASHTDTDEGLKYSHKKFKEFNVEVRSAHEKAWTDAVEQSKNCMQKLKPSSFSEQNKNNKNAERGFATKRNAEAQPSLGSPKKFCRNIPSPQTELCVIVNNLSMNITKTEIKNIFDCNAIPNYRIKHLLNKWGERTHTALITFENAEDHASALKMNGATVGLKNIEVLSITKDKMFAILRENRCIQMWRQLSYGSTKLTKRLIYARNFPANVRKDEVRDFFSRFNICEDAVRLLEDSQGNGIGEAIVLFESEEISKQAQKLHGKNFMQAKILLTCISQQQMEKIIGTCGTSGDTRIGAKSMEIWTTDSLKKVSHAK